MEEYKLRGMLPISKIAGKAFEKELLETDKVRKLHILKHQSASFMIVDTEISG